MPLTSEQRDALVNELRKIGAELNLSDEQKQKVQSFMAEASEKVQEYKKQNPGATQQDVIEKIKENRAGLRERLENFLTPEQLEKWDSEVAKSKEFLGQKFAA
jgi:periplasmic protein CpxP/Spy